MRTSLLTLNRTPRCCFPYNHYHKCFVMNGLRSRSARNQERFLTVRIPKYSRSFISSSSSNDDTATSHVVRQQLLTAASAELQRVKHYYASEFNYTTSSTTGSTTSNLHHQQCVMNAPLILETTTDVQNYLKDIDTLMFDCDGVLYRSPHPTPDVSQAILQLLRPPQKKLLFVTNNGSVSRSQLQQKITSFLKLPDDLLTTDMMITSAYACSQYLKSQVTSQQPRPQNIFCIGSEGTCNELIDAGFLVIHGNSETVSSMTRDDLANYDFTSLLPESKSRSDSSSSSSFSSRHDYPKIDAVVIGHDTNFTYRKLCLATVLLQQNPTAVLVATNMDSYDITGIDRRHIPGNGALVKAVEHASHRIAINLGKPSRTLFDLIQSQAQLNVERTAFVGDRLDTDIRFGVDHGMKSILVLTGVTNVNVLRRIHTGTTEEPLPTAIISHVGLMAPV